MEQVFHGVRVDRVVWTPPKKVAEEPEVKLTLSITTSNTAAIKRLLDFCQADVCTWTVQALQREMVPPKAP